MARNGCGQSGHRTGCISTMNWSNELIFCMAVQIQESKKLFQWFLGGSGQKWASSFSSWYPKICWISLWIEVIFCMLTVMQIWYLWILPGCQKPWWSCVWQPDFFKKLFFPPKFGKWAKNRFSKFKEKFGH